VYREALGRGKEGGGGAVRKQTDVETGVPRGRGKMAGIRRVREGSEDSVGSPAP
jgi:hypothetical protein